MPRFRSPSASRPAPAAPTHRTRRLCGRVKRAGRWQGPLLAQLRPLFSAGKLLLDITNAKYDANQIESLSAVRSPPTFPLPDPLLLPVRLRSACSRASCIASAALGG